MQRHAEVAEHLRVVGLQLQRLLELGDGVFRSPDLAEDAAQVVAGVGVSRVQRDGLAQQVQRDVLALCAMRQQAQTAQGLGVFWLLG